MGWYNPGTCWHFFYRITALKGLFANAIIFQDDPDRQSHTSCHPMRQYPFFWYNKTSLKWGLMTKHMTNDHWRKGHLYQPPTPKWWRHYSWKYICFKYLTCSESQSHCLSFSSSHPAGFLTQQRQWSPALLAASERRLWTTENQVWWTEPETHPTLVPPLPLAEAWTPWAPRTLEVPKTRTVATNLAMEKRTSKSTFMSHSMMDTAAAGLVSITFSS